MWITRAILIILGFWLLRRIMLLFRGRRPRPDGEIRSSPKREKVNPFRGAQVRDAEFEDLDDPKERSGDKG